MVHHDDIIVEKLFFASWRKVELILGRKDGTIGLEVIDMNLRQRQNEDRIFKAIQDLKDSIFGLRQSYIPFCYTNDQEDGYRFSEEKTALFVAELSEYAGRTRTYSDELKEAMPLFFEVSLKLLAAICSSGDWVFVSFRKLANAAMKDSSEEESTFERIVASHRAPIERMFPTDSFWLPYEKFCGYMGRVNAENFSLCVKHTVEDFLDDHCLNCLDKDQLTESIVARISRLSASIERDLDRAEFPEEDG